jgi:hypothetical protein
MSATLLAHRVAQALWQRRHLDAPEQLLRDELRDPALSGIELAAASRSARAELSLVLPSGLGMFASGLEACGTPSQVEAQVRASGISWVAVLADWQYRARPTRRWNTDSRALDYLAAIRSGGAAVWVWGWPVPGKETEFCQQITERALAWGAVGIILDVEAPYYRQRAAGARLLDEALTRAHAEGMAVGLTSFGAPWWHSTLPWAELGRADFGVPQIYDSKNNLGPGYPARALAAWRAMGFDGRSLIPAFPTYGKTPAELTAHLALFPASAAAIGWQWRTTRGAEWALVRRFGERLAGSFARPGGIS